MILRQLPCRDGYVYLKCTQQSEWQALMGLVAGDGWQSEQRFKGMFEGDFDQLGFLSSWGETIRPLVAKWAKQHTETEALETTRNLSIPLSPSRYAGLGYLPCKDGYVVCGCREAYQWQQLMTLVVGDELINDERFRGLFDTGFNLVEFLTQTGPMLWPEIVKWAESRTREEITTAAQAKGIPIVPCNTIEDLFESAHLRERGFLVDIDHPRAGSLRYPGAPFHLSETPWTVDRPAPLLGQHNREILGDGLGLSEQEIASMKATGII